MEPLILATFWILYFILHSILASNWIKQLIKNKLSTFYSFYRLTYNGVALITLILVLQFQGSITPIFFFQKTILLQIIGFLIIVLGAILGYLAFKNYSTAEFLGLDYNKFPEENKDIINTSGFNSFVRHPLYFASLLLIWGYFIVNPNSNILIMNGVITAYLIIGTKLEEQKLIKEFGQQYKDYINQVPMLLPSISLLIKQLKK
ncbi:MAG: isoprenylcysteine carboxylmethyltransferase family protein [Urechidicola sp.]|nr:isoprenylcysteine carboxylmethyltransferase family protein [Urechidicola sp.]